MNKPTPEHLDEEIHKGKHIDEYPEVAEPVEWDELLLAEIRRILEPHGVFDVEGEILAKVKQHYEQEMKKLTGGQRIIKWVEDTDILTMLPPRQRREWQALKEEKEKTDA